MQIWVGLGNPGPRYALHRHNVGFMAVDVIADMHDFGPVQKKFSGWAQEGRIGSQKVLLLKPATFMNESGRAVGEALRFYKLGTDALTVFHDELDLAPGSFDIIVSNCVINLVGDKAKVWLALSQWVVMGALPQRMCKSKSQSAPLKSSLESGARIVIRRHPQQRLPGDGAVAHRRAAAEAAGRHADATAAEVAWPADEDPERDAAIATASAASEYSSERCWPASDRV